jgi:hydrogenase maturation protein HypF
VVVAPAEATAAADRVRRRVTVTGTVQGVGFRPHVHRLATSLGLSGTVGNDTTSVDIEVEGPPEVVERFVSLVVAEAPPLASIDAVEIATVPTRWDTSFDIAASRHAAGPTTTAPPDTAACADCLRELGDPRDRRHRYPFITCTNCGPRFTIITALPYDRPATTMAAFPLCHACDTEYHDPTDRRFHAQPVACHDCGPRLRLHAGDEVVVGGGRQDTDAVLARAQQLLRDGAIVAVKGVGGYHLACRADRGPVVEELRRRKHRPGKPFALVARDLDVARRVAEVSEAEAALLTTPAAPIVLLRRRADAALATTVAPGNPFVGVMLPASPLHHLLLSDVPGVDHTALDLLVLTSGNLSEEPLCTDDDEAFVRLADIADAFLVHDREIAVACDDSVVRLDEGMSTPTLLRRSRGYVPTPIPLPFLGRPSLALGGELKTTACLTDGRRAWLSAHIGDQGSLATLHAFERTVERFAAMHDTEPEQLVVDAHPDYVTHRWARRRPDGLAVVEVQHHHAHVAAVMTEHGLDGTSPVIGVAFDGTGYGADGTIWGGEVLLADYGTASRLGHLVPVLLPGGDAAIRHPRRVALSYLRSAGVPWRPELAPVAATADEELQLLSVQLDRQVSCVPTSSMGRLFDAVASLLDVRHDITYEAQAAVELEVLASTVPAPAVSLTLPLRQDPSGTVLLDGPSLVRGLVDARCEGAEVAELAAAFHRAVAVAVRDLVRRIRAAGGPDVVALSGGVFANAMLTRLIAGALREDGVTVLTHRLVPPNDGGLALGQAAVGAWRQRPLTDDPSTTNHRP